MAVAERLRRALGEGRVIVDPDVMDAYRRDHAHLAGAGRPAAVVLARSVDDVRTTVATAGSEGVPVVPRGAGSGLAGGANAVDGGVTLVTAMMDRVVSVDRSRLSMRVEPGVLNTDVKAAAAAAGLFYPPDPASSAISSIGGNIATNAGGLCCVKYGVTRDYVLGLEVVLADGTLARTGGATRKSSAGLDLTALMVGSEGTLGVIVGATLRLVPRPEEAATVVASFRHLEAVCRLPGVLAGAGITPSLLEVVDGHTLNAVEDHTPMGLDRSLGALVIAQTDGPGRGQEAVEIARLCTGLGAVETFHSADPVEAGMLLTARKLAYPALEAVPGTVALLDDVAVPIDRVSDLIAAVERIADSAGIRIATFGHLGDGNLHPTILHRPGDEARAGEAFDAVVAAALDLEGTVTGEHGVGTLKVRHLGAQLDEATVRAQHAVKAALDPAGILNPGKGLPPPAVP